jgi:voltage-gated potassium channel
VAELRTEGVAVLVVEPKPELAELLEGHGIPHLPADPTEETALHQAGIQRARGLLCAMDSDAANVFITLTARALNPTLTIVARASNPTSVDKLLRAGADHVVSPYDVSGRHMGVLALHPAIVDFLDMAKLAPGLRLEEIEVRTGSPLAGKGVGETRARYPDAQILALKRSGDAHVAVPDHDTVLAAGDLVLVLGPEQTLKTMAG